MVFSSLIFLVCFLPLFLLAYYASPARYRNHVALAGSAFFYAWGAPRFIFVLAIACLVNFRISKRIEAAPVDSSRRRQWLTVGVALNVALLGYFKYANFFVSEVNEFITALGNQPIRWVDVALPVGISFFTFQKISYLVDVYRRTARPLEKFGDFALFAFLFPQLIAGPIIRYHDVATQLTGRTYSRAMFFQGIWRFCLGLAKKVLLANTLGEVADRVFAMDASAMPTSAAWLGLMCYSFQIFFDFSGYSDMAIGLGRMIGFEFMENFNAPYIATSITDFWRRWHISLSNFMREYVYIPLGGNRSGPWRSYLNLWIVFLLSGFWHGAAWTFVIWGAYHGLFLTLDKLFWAARAERLPKWISIPITFLLVSLGWVWFRSASAGDALHYFARLFDWSSSSVATVTSVGELLSHRAAVTLGVAVVCSFMPVFWQKSAKMPSMPTAPVSTYVDRPGIAWAKCAASLGLLVLSFVALVSERFNPFIYFRF